MIFVKVLFVSILFFYCIMLVTVSNNFVIMFWLFAVTFMSGFIYCDPIGRWDENFDDTFRSVGLG